MLNENQKKHLKHRFYAESDAYRREVKNGQILKGAEKYPKPFSHEIYTAEELLLHAMQENVDQEHYIYGLYKKIKEESEFRIERLESAIVGMQYVVSFLSSSYLNDASSSIPHFQAAKGVLKILETLLEYEKRGEQK